MAEVTQYAANTGMVTISTANSNLDGTGTLGTVLTSENNGTLIKTVTIKSQGSTTEGMVRLFVYDGTNTRLLKEIEVPAVTQSAIFPSFETIVSLNFSLKAGYSLKASTENAETFNVIAEALNWSYYATSVRTDTTEYTANTGSGNISTANGNLNGIGTIVQILTASGSGTSIESITTKCQVSPPKGMVRLFIDDNNGHVLLFREVPIKPITKSSTATSFENTLVFENDFELQAGYSISAATQFGNTFSIAVEGLDWTYLP